MSAPHALAKWIGFLRKRVTKIAINSYLHKPGALVPCPPRRFGPALPAFSADFAGVVEPLVPRHQRFGPIMRVWWNPWSRITFVFGRK